MVAVLRIAPSRWHRSCAVADAALVGVTPAARVVLRHGGLEQSPSTVMHRFHAHAHASLIVNAHKASEVRRGTACSETHLCAPDHDLVRFFGLNPIEVGIDMALPNRLQRLGPNSTAGVGPLVIAGRLQNRPEVFGLVGAGAASS